MNASRIILPLVEYCYDSLRVAVYQTLSICTEINMVSYSQSTLVHCSFEYEKNIDCNHEIHLSSMTHVYVITAVSLQIFFQLNKIFLHPDDLLFHITSYPRF